MVRQGSVKAPNGFYPHDHRHPSKQEEGLEQMFFSADYQKKLKLPDWQLL